jgi:uncharacterized protein (TIRG00374 family)
MRFGWRGAIGFLLSAGLLVFTLRDVQFAEVWAALQHANPWYFAASAFCSTVLFALRAIRWRPILHDVAPDVAFGPLWRATTIGMMINNVVPARAGELARAFALTRERRDVPFAAAFASLVVDRLFDSVVLLLLLSSAMFAPGFPTGVSVAGRPVTQFAVGLGIISAVAAIAVASLAFAPDRIVRLFELFAGRVAPKLEARGVALLRTFAAGMGVLRNPARFANVFLWTLAHWLTNALAFWLGFKAVGLDLPFSAGNFLQGVIAVGVAVPSSPGFFGVFEYSAKSGLAVYGVSSSAAVTWAIGFHLLSYIPITVIGAYYFGKLGLSLADLGKEEQRAEAAVE